jgi:hypothetical protein
MNPTPRKYLITSLAALLGAVGLVAFYPAPFRWTAKKIQRAVYPEQILEGPVYAETARAPLDLATFVRDARRAWPQAGVRVVHGATVDVATGLLMHPDIEVGSIVNGAFVAWDLSRWRASAKIREELAGMSGFLAEPRRYVFRRKAS